MKRFTIVNNGYNVDEVNRFIDVVIKRLEKLNSDNALMQMKISSLEEQLQKSKKEEVNLGEAIVAAQKTADRIKSLAREESNRYLAKIFPFPFALNDGGKLYTSLLILGKERILSIYGFSSNPSEIIRIFFFL